MASSRESVHTRPAHLDDLIKRLNAGETYDPNATKAAAPHLPSDHHQPHSTTPYVDRYSSDRQRHSTLLSDENPAYSGRYESRDSTQWPPHTPDDAHPAVPAGASDDDAAARWELERELDVQRRQIDTLQRHNRQLADEVSLHKKHIAEFRGMLELAESDLGAVHESSAQLEHQLHVARRPAGQKWRVSPPAAQHVAGV